MWIGKRGGNVFTTSGADWGISMQTNDGKKKNLNNEYLNPEQSLKLEELRKGFNKMLNDKKTKFRRHSFFNVNLCNICISILFW